MEPPADTPSVVSNTSNKLTLDQDNKESANQPRQAEAKATVYRKIKIGTVLITLDMGQQLQCNAMLDNGCEMTSIDREWVRTKGLNTTKIQDKIIIKNANGSNNQDGTCDSIL
jgi:hypothetical protein